MKCQAGIKIAGRNINNLRYAEDTTLRIPLLKPEELKSFLMRVKEVSEKAGLKFNIKKKVRSWHLVPSLDGKYKGKQWTQCQTLFWGDPKSLQW